MIRAATKCTVCGRSFRSVDALKKHLLTGHPELSGEELERLQASLPSQLLVGAGLMQEYSPDLTPKFPTSGSVDRDVVGASDGPLGLDAAAADGSDSLNASMELSSQSEDEGASSSFPREFSSSSARVSCTRRVFRAASSKISVEKRC